MFICNLTDSNNVPNSIALISTFNSKAEDLLCCAAGLNTNPPFTRNSLGAIRLNTHGIPLMLDEVICKFIIY